MIQLNGDHTIFSSKKNRPVSVQCPESKHAMGEHVVAFTGVRISGRRMYFA